MSLNRARRELLGAALALSVLSCSLMRTAPGEPRHVRKVDEEIVVAAWAEPARLPRGGGQAQILVRVQKRGGERFPGVEVSLAASAGTLYSAGQVLVTDRQGTTRDRLTTTRTTTITLNAGGTRYRFRLPVGDDER